MPSPDLIPRGEVNKSWSRDDIEQLKSALRAGMPIPRLAERLRCCVGEIHGVITELVARHASLEALRWPR